VGSHGVKRSGGNLLASLSAIGSFSILGTGQDA
jgi:hypothetical protein